MHPLIKLVCILAGQASANPTPPPPGGEPLTCDQTDITCDQTDITCDQTEE